MAGKRAPRSAGQSSDTTTCVVADRWGNVVAATPSGWGSVVDEGGGTGVTHGTRLVSLNTWEGHPNVVAPGKRPRITLTPTIVLKQGKPVIAISVAGGDHQDQVSLQLLLDSIEFGMEPARAVTVPRFATAHHTGSFSQPDPQLGSLSLYEGTDEAVADDLKGRGHQPAVRGAGGQSGHASGGPRGGNGPGGRRSQGGPPRRGVGEWRVKSG